MQNIAFSFLLSLKRITTNCHHFEENCALKPQFSNYGDRTLVLEAEKLNFKIPSSHCLLLYYGLTRVSDGDVCIN